MSLHLGRAKSSGCPPPPPVRLNERKGVRKVFVSAKFPEGEPTIKFGRVSANTKSRDKHKIVNNK